MPKPKSRRSSLRCVACLAALLLCLCASPLRADELTPAKQADIRRLLEVSGSMTAATQMVAGLGDQLAQGIRQKRPDTSQRALDIVRDEARAVLQEKLTGPGGLFDRLVPVYGATFTHQEIRELLVFYSSPTGRKAAASQPALMAQGRQLGEQLAREIGPELKRRIDAALQREGLAPAQ